MLISVIRKSVVRAALIAVAAILVPSDASAAAGWSTSWDSASETARSCRQPLVVLFEHEGCPDCEIMSEALAARASRNALECAVKVRLEFTRHPELTARYGVSLTPTFLVLRPEGNSMKEVYREVGSMSVSRIVQVGDSIRSLAAKLAEEPAAKKAEKKSSEEVQVASADAAPETERKAKPKKKAGSSSTKRRTRKSSTEQTRPAEQPAQQQPYNQQPVYQQPQRRGLWPFW